MKKYNSLPNTVYDVAEDFFILNTSLNPLPI